jgi:hypothetical protein
MIHPNPLEVEHKSPEGMHAGLINMYCACKNLTSTKEGENSFHACDKLMQQMSHGCAADAAAFLLSGANT